MLLNNDRPPITETHQPITATLPMPNPFIPFPQCFSRRKPMMAIFAKIQNPKSAIKNPKSEIQNQQSLIRFYSFFSEERITFQGNSVHKYQQKFFFFNPIFPFAFFAPLAVKSFFLSMQTIRSQFPLTKISNHKSKITNPFPFAPLAVKSFFNTMQTIRNQQSKIKNPKSPLTVTMPNRIIPSPA